MRAALLTLVALGLAGCPASLDKQGVAGDDGNGSGSDLGLSPQCGRAADCVAAGPKCCDCPTFAVPVGDPVQRACSGVTCPANSCPTNVAAACEQGQCVLACKPVVCDQSCADGFVVDASGCLTCACATAPAGQCTGDAECARVKADCCGCAQGGEDTAVPVADVGTHDAGLMCPASPVCPGLDTCAPELAPRCIQGACALISGGLPPAACGRPDLPACPANQACTLNADAAADQQGVGVCI